MQRATKPELLLLLLFVTLDESKNMAQAAKSEVDGKIDLSEWIVDKSCRATANNDRCIDYLDMYGRGQKVPNGTNGTVDDLSYMIKPDNEESDYKGQLEFVGYIGERKRDFFHKVVNWMITKLGSSAWKDAEGDECPSPAVRILDTYAQINHVQKYYDTLTAMHCGIPIIIKGLLHDHKNDIIGTPDLLIRSDILPIFFDKWPSLPCAEEEITEATLNPLSASLSGVTAEEKINRLNKLDGLSSRSSMGAVKVATTTTGSDKEIIVISDDDEEVQEEIIPDVSTEDILGTDAGETKGPEDKQYHYSVVHVRFAYLELSKKEYPRLLPSSHNGKYYEALINAQTRALDSCTGQATSKQGYMLGRGWKCGDNRCDYVFNLLGVIPCNPDCAAMSIVNQTVNWFKRLRTEGKSWQLFPKPSNKELYPNLKNRTDFPWSKAKAKLGEYLKELTNLFYVTYAHRNLALSRGISSYDDPKLTVEIMGFKSPKDSKVSSHLSKIIKAQQWGAGLPQPPDSSSKADGSVDLPDGKREELKIEDVKSFIDATPIATVKSSPGGKGGRVAPPVWPQKFTSRYRKILDKFNGIEYTADFETKSSIDDDLRDFPYSTDTTMVPMIGSGYEHPIKKLWTPKLFKARWLIKSEEVRIFTDWFNWMDESSRMFKHLFATGGTGGISAPPASPFKDLLPLNNLPVPDDPSKMPLYKVFHWSKAEENFLERNFNSAAARHKREDWRGKVFWADLHKLCREEQLAINGSFNCTLKSVNKALYKHGCIDNVWISSPVEHGMAASIALLRSHEEAVAKGTTMDKTQWDRYLDPYLQLDIYTTHCDAKFFREYGFV
jgi:hypothetical protein